MAVNGPVKILESLAPVVLALKDAGVPANIDPAKLNPPCVWVQPTEVEETYLDGSGDLSCDVYLVAKDAGLFESMLALEKLLAKVLTVLDPDGPIDLAAGIETSDNRVLPAFKFPLIVRTVP